MMKRTQTLGTTLLGGFAVMLLTLVTGAQAFEGVVQQQKLIVAEEALQPLLDSEGSPEPCEVFAIPVEQIRQLGATDELDVEEENMTIFIKGQQVRVDVELEQDKDAFMLVDTADETSYLVMPSTKQYLEWTKEDRENMQKMAQGLRDNIKNQLRDLDSIPPEQRKQMKELLKHLPDEKNKVIQPLNKSERINGMDVTGYEVRAEGETTLGWVTKDHGDILTVLKAVSESQERPKSTDPEKRTAADVLTEHGLPVRVQTLEDDQYTISEITKIEQKSLAPNLFVVPDGYTKIKPDNMLDGNTQQPELKGLPAPDFDGGTAPSQPPQKPLYPLTESKHRDNGRHRLPMRSA